MLKEYNLLFGAGILLLDNEIYLLTVSLLVCILINY